MVSRCTGPNPMLVCPKCGYRYEFVLPMEVHAPETKSGEEFLSVLVNVCRPALQILSLLWICSVMTLYGEFKDRMDPSTIAYNLCRMGLAEKAYGVLEMLSVS